MKTFIKIVLLFVLTASISSAQEESYVTIHQSRGKLSWDTLEGNYHYSIEWAPHIQGPWYRGWNDFVNIASTGATMTVVVPKFYRVVAIKGQEVEQAIPGGSFTMGDQYGVGPTIYGVQQTREMPAHIVYVDPIYMDTYEVTQKYWDHVRQWALINGYTDLASGSSTGPDFPVQFIDWQNAVKWCNARSEMEGKTPVYYTTNDFSTVYRTGSRDLLDSEVDWSADGFRLPTEAEWERAARGGLEQHYYPWDSYGGDWSDHIDNADANYESSGDPFGNGPSPVGYYNGTQSITPAGLVIEDKPNNYGLYDMAGNMNEMVWDRFGEFWYTNANAVADNTHGPEIGSQRVIKSASWDSFTAGLVRCAYRHPWSISSPHKSIGFRCARNRSE